jgi:hypothetical protein
MGATTKPEINREQEIYLMDSEYLNSLSWRGKIYIHRCRRNLQVETCWDFFAASFYFLKDFKTSCRSSFTGFAWIGEYNLWTANETMNVWSRNEFLWQIRSK